jgi:hypothetical protein
MLANDTGGGIAKWMENKAESIPIVGDMIRSRREESGLGLNRAALNHALAPIGEELPANMPMGREALDHVSQRLSDRYDALLPRMAAHADQQFTNELTHIMGEATCDLPEAQVEQLHRIHQRIFDDFFHNTPAGSPTYTMPGENMKGLDTRLGELSRGYASDASHDNR